MSKLKLYTTKFNNNKNNNNSTPTCTSWLDVVFQYLRIWEFLSISKLFLSIPIRFSTTGNLSDDVETLKRFASPRPKVNNKAKQKRKEKKTPTNKQKLWSCVYPVRSCSKKKLKQTNIKQARPPNKNSNNKQQQDQTMTKN